MKEDPHDFGQKKIIDYEEFNCCSLMEVASIINGNAMSLLISIGHNNRVHSFMVSNNSIFITIFWAVYNDEFLY